MNRSLVASAHCMWGVVSAEKGREVEFSSPSPFIFLHVSIVSVWH